MSKDSYNISFYEVNFMQEEFKILGKRVKFLRMERGVSQTNMAEMIGLSQTNLSNMESGRTAITTQNLFKMREVLKCKMSDFFIDFDNEEPMCKGSNGEKKTIELEDALNILRLLKTVDIKGL